MLENLPINSDDPMFLAAECFRDTLIEIGVDEDSAENGRRTFLSLKKNTMEETQNKIRRIASRMILKRANSHEWIQSNEQSREESKEIVRFGGLPRMSTLKPSYQKNSLPGDLSNEIRSDDTIK